MADLSKLFSAAELKALDRKKHATLTKHAVRLVRTSLDIRNIIKKDPKVRKKLRAKLRPIYNRLKG
jgi:predicted transcriptional regulator